MQEPSSEHVVTFTKHKHPFFKLYSMLAKSFVALLPVPFPPRICTNQATPNHSLIEIDSSSFDKSHLEVLIDFYAHSDWNPRVIERPLGVGSGVTSLQAYNLSPPELAFLLRINDSRQMLPKVYEACRFFSLQAALRLCLVLVGSYTGYPHNNLSLLAKSKKRLRIDGVLDSKAIMSLQRKYPGACDVGEDEDGEELEEEDEFEDVDEEEEEDLDRGEEEEQYYEFTSNMGNIPIFGRGPPPDLDPNVDLSGFFGIDAETLAQNKQFQELVKTLPLMLGYSSDFASGDADVRFEGFTPEQLLETLRQSGSDLRLDLNGKTFYFKQPDFPRDDSQDEPTPP